MQNKLSTLKNILVHIVVLAVVFVVAVVAFSKFINQTTPSTAEVMENSTFPLVYMQNKGVNYNCLHGYAKEMDVNYIRDTVTSLGTVVEPDETTGETKTGRWLIIHLWI